MGYAFIFEGLSFGLNILILYFITDARREARKAFLAFASEDTKAPNPADFEPVEGEPESFIEQPADDDAQSSQSLPVRNSPCYPILLSLFLSLWSFFKL